VIFEFYDALIPPDIYNGAAFEKWRREAEAEIQAAPTHARLPDAPRRIRHHRSAVPETLAAGGAEFKLAYRFDPGHALDGVTITVPLALLNTLDAADFDWLVPGLIRDKVAFAFKALPKTIRRNLVPVPET